MSESKFRVGRDPGDISVVCHRARMALDFKNTQPGIINLTRIGRGRETGPLLKWDGILLVSHAWSDCKCEGHYVIKVTATAKHLL